MIMRIGFRDPEIRIRTVIIIGERVDKLGEASPYERVEHYDYHLRAGDSFNIKFSVDADTLKEPK